VPSIHVSKKTSTWLVVLFFLVLTSLGLFTSSDYGQPWDEPWEQDILRLNLNQYAATLGLSSQLTSHSSMPWPQSGLIADSVEKDHGECAYYPTYWLMQDHSLPTGTAMTIWHAYTWLLFMTGAVALWFISRRLGLSRLLSCVATLFLVLSPRMFAEGHYNNKDVVLLALVLLTLWQALRLMEKPTFPRALFFSLAGAAATNTKIIGLLVWGLCALAVLIRQIAGKRMNRRVWLIGLVSLLSFFGFYTLVTPALWTDPAGYLGYVLGNAANFSRWENYVLFRGAIYHLKNVDLPRSYLPYMILVTTPLWLCLLIGLGQLFAVTRFVILRKKPFADDTGMALLLLTLLWLFPLAYDFIVQPTIYNGWRHFYFIFGPMLALAAYGLQRTGDWFRQMKSPVFYRIGAGALGICMAFTGTQIVISHPNQYTYYNAVVGNRSNLSTYLELDYWNVSVLATLRSLLREIDSNEQKTITGSDYASQTGLISAYALLSSTEQGKLRVLPQGSLGSKYVLVNSTYATLNYWKPQKNMQIVVETSSFGQMLSMVYQRTGK